MEDTHIAVLIRDVQKTEKSETKQPTVQAAMCGFLSCLPSVVAKEHLRHHEHSTTIHEHLQKATKFIDVLPELAAFARRDHQTTA